MHHNRASLSNVRGTQKNFDILQIIFSSEFLKNMILFHFWKSYQIMFVREVSFKFHYGVRLTNLVRTIDKDRSWIFYI